MACGPGDQVRGVVGADFRAALLDGFGASGAATANWCGHRLSEFFCLQCVAENVVSTEKKQKTEEEGEDDDDDDSEDDEDDEEGGDEKEGGGADEGGDDEGDDEDNSDDDEEGEKKEEEEEKPKKKLKKDKKDKKKKKSKGSDDESEAEDSVRPWLDPHARHKSGPMIDLHLCLERVKLCAVDTNCASPSPCIARILVQAFGTWPIIEKSPPMYFLPKHLFEKLLKSFFRDAGDR